MTKSMYEPQQDSNTLPEALFNMLYDLIAYLLSLEHKQTKVE